MNIRVYKAVYHDGNSDVEVAFKTTASSPEQTAFDAWHVLTKQVSGFFHARIFDDGNWKIMRVSHGERELGYIMEGARSHGNKLTQTPQ